MTISKIKKGDARGFTLIEVIVALVILAIVATFLVTYMGTGITQSGLPVTWVQREFDIYQAMEKINVDYQKAVSLPNFDLGAFAGTVQATYGTGGVSVTNDFINIDRLTGNVSTADSATGLILKVTLQESSHSLASLFTR